MIVQLFLKLMFNANILNATGLYYDMLKIMMYLQSSYIFSRPNKLYILCHIHKKREYLDVVFGLASCVTTCTL